LGSRTRPRQDSVFSARIEHARHHGDPVAEEDRHVFDELAEY
jgi:hypothetical protein